MLEILYNLPAAHEQLFGPLGPENKLRIVVDRSDGMRSNAQTKDVLNSGGDSGVVTFNPNQTDVFINLLGEVVPYDPIRVLAHEILHAVRGTNDPRVGELEAGPFTDADYQGANVVLENAIFAVDDPAATRASYIAAFGDTVPVSFGYTTDNRLPGLEDRNGLPFENVLIALGTTKIPLGEEIRDSAGVGSWFDETKSSHQLLTDENSEDLSDLLLGSSRNNFFSSGEGDDWLYGGPGGGDTFHSGAGSDVIFGGSGGYAFLPEGGNADLTATSSRTDHQLTQFEALDTVFYTQIVETAREDVAVEVVVSSDDPIIVNKGEDEFDTLHGIEFIHTSTLDDSLVYQGSAVDYLDPSEGPEIVTVRRRRSGAAPM